MAHIRTLMHHTVEQSPTVVPAGELASGDELAGHPLFFFPTVTSYRHSDVTWGATPWVAQDFTPPMGTVVILLLVAIFTTGVRQLQWRKLGLIKTTTEALVLGQIVLSIAVVTVRAGPTIKSKQFLCS
jgi:hypothetical protein